MKPVRLMTCLIVLAAAGAAASAQPGTASGPPCPAASGASAPVQGCGPGRAGPRMQWGPRHTPGWSMMTPDEQKAHRDRLGEFKTYEECHAYMEKHHQDMVARAKERNGAVPRAPRRDACSSLPKAAK